MADRDLTLAMRLQADAARWNKGLSSAERGTRRFGTAVKEEMSAIGRSMRSVTGMLAGIGVSYSAVTQIIQSAKMDQSLIKIGQTAGMTKDQVAQLRKELFRMGGETGQSIDSLQEGFNRLVQSGLNFKQAVPTLDAINKAMAVTGSSAETLSAALTATAANFNFDLSKPGQALKLLDEMTFAGRKGNAELENLSSIVGGTAAGAARSGMGFTQLLAFTEALSLKQQNPDILRTQVRAGLRMFTQLRNMKQIAGTSGIKFFDAKGNRRDAFAIMADIKKITDGLKTEKQRAIFLGTIFKGADTRAIRTWAQMLSGDTLSKAVEFRKDIEQAPGTITHDLPAAVSNAVDQTGRLRDRLRKAADDFSKPINATIAKLIAFGLDSKDKGGLGLSGQQILGGSAALALGTLVTARFGGKLFSALAGKVGGLGAGVATGKALEQATGIQPVFVVNWPTSMGGLGVDIPGGKAAEAVKEAVKKGGGTLGRIARAGKSAGLVGAAGAAGYGAGTLLYDHAIAGTTVGDKIGEGVAKVLAFFGNEDAKRAVAMTEKLQQTKVGGEIRIKVDSDGRAQVRAISDNSRVPMSVDAGLVMAGP